MEENIELVDGTTENVEEQTTEQIVVPEKTYTEAEFNERMDELLAKKIGRKEAKIRREYESKYGELENIIKTGMKVDTLEDGIESLKEFYTKRGIPIPTRNTTSGLTEQDEQYLAEKYADEILDGSDYDEVQEEADMLASKGFDNMTKRDKIVFSKLNTYLKEESARKELASMGISDSILKDEDFTSFTENLNPNLSVKEKYDLYVKYRPKAKVEPIGTMRGTTQQESGVKEFYTKEEAMQFTREEFDKNPELFKAVENSMSKW